MPQGGRKWGKQLDGQIGDEAYRVRQHDANIRWQLGCIDGSVQCGEQPILTEYGGGIGETENL